MCQFCVNDFEKYDDFNKWFNTNPYDGDDQVDKEGIDFILFPNGVFKVAAKFDGGYISDDMIMRFNYCPRCGKLLV